MPSSRERVLSAIDHRQPDRVPATLYIEPALRQRLERETDVLDGCEDDTVRILWEVVAEDIDEQNFRDPFGVRWIRSEGAYFYKNPPLDQPDAARIPRIRLLPEGERERIISLRRANPDKFIYYQFTMTYGERLWTLRGMEDYLMDMISEPDFIHAALDILLELHLEAVDELIGLPIDGITFGDDFGSQKGMMISPALFRTFYKDRLAILYRRVRDAGLVAGAHSCGDNTEIMGDFVDIGLQVFHPLQSECMDIRKIKREFGQDLSFRGGIGVQGALVYGAPDQVRMEVLNAAKILSAGGGYLMESCKPLPAETPLDNAVAFVTALKDAVSYNF